MPVPLSGPGPVPDDLPRSGLWIEPLRATLEALPLEDVDGGRRVTFRATVEDAVGQRCPDLAVEATITGPVRSGQGLAHTDLLGRVRFRTTGPPGTYRCDVVDVGAGALRLRRPGDGPVATLEVDVE